MRGFFLYLIAGLASLLILTAQPSIDAYTATGAGYTVKDSDESDGPTYTWDDLSAGIPVTWNFALPDTFVNDDVVSQALTLPFSFPFFGGSFNQAYVASNGLLWFDVPIAASTFSNDPIPTNTTIENNFIAPFWDDLAAGNATGGTLDVRYLILGSGASQRFVVQWIGLAFFADATATMTFQVAIYANGGIRMQYQTMTDGATANRTAGSQATIGIEDATGSSGLQYLYNGTPGGNDAEANLAIGFLPTGATEPWPFPGSGTGTGTTTGPGTTTTPPTTTTAGAGGGGNGREGANGDGLCSAGVGSGGLGWLLFVILGMAVGIRRRA